MKHFKNNIQNRRKLATAIFNLHKSTLVDINLFKSKIEEQDLEIGREKLYAIWNQLIFRNTIRKEKSLYRWNGDINLWSNIDEATKQVEAILPHTVKKQHKKSFKVAVPIDNKLFPQLQSINDKALVEELRRRGWNITASRQVTVTEQL